MTTSDQLVDYHEGNAPSKRRKRVVITTTRFRIKSNTMKNTSQRYAFNLYTTLIHNKKSNN